MKFCLIYNKKSAGGRKTNFIKKIVYEIRKQYQVDFFETKSEKQASEIIKNIPKNQYNRLLLAGGDGSVSFAINELIKNGLYSQIWQAYAALLPIKTVGVMGDSRTYENICLLRAVTSEDGMSADYFSFPKYFIDNISNKIINNVKGINRVVYDVTSKPPSTIELE